MKDSERIWVTAMMIVAIPHFFENVKYGTVVLHILRRGLLCTRNILMVHEKNERADASKMENPCFRYFLCNSGRLLDISKHIRGLAIFVCGRRPKQRV